MVTWRQCEWDMVVQDRLRLVDHCNTLKTTATHSRHWRLSTGARHRRVQQHTDLLMNLTQSYSGTTRVTWTSSATKGPSSTWPTATRMWSNWPLSKMYGRVPLMVSGVCLCLLSLSCVSVLCLSRVSLSCVSLLCLSLVSLQPSLSRRVPLVLSCMSVEGTRETWQTCPLVQEGMSVNCLSYSPLSCVSRTLLKSSRLF